MGRRREAQTVTEISRDKVAIPPFFIHVRGVDQSVETISLGLHSVVIGTDDDADIVLQDSRVSGKHCALRATPTGILLEDKKSKNGTWIGPVRVREVLLPVGLHVAIGRSEIWVERQGTTKVERLSKTSRFGDVLGESQVMRLLFEDLRRAAPKEEIGILLLGETGTGKTTLAKAVHQASGRTGRFVLVSCGETPEPLIASELFGHLRGSFTGAVARRGKLAEADTGTLFIDEIGELPLESQKKLLTAIDEKKYCPIGSNAYQSFQAQIITATHKNLRQMVREGKFRQDLYYRLAALTVTVPPLRDRREDIPLIVESFLARQSPPVAPSALQPWFSELLQSYHFPGNVRELENLVRSHIHLPGVPLPLDQEEPPDSAPRHVTLERELLAKPYAVAREIGTDRFLRVYLTGVLEECGGNVAAAAKRMGINEKYLYKLKRRLHLP